MRAAPWTEPLRTKSAITLGSNMVNAKLKRVALPLSLQNYVKQTGILGFNYAKTDVKILSALEINVRAWCEIKLYTVTLINVGK